MFLVAMCVVTVISKPVIAGQTTTFEVEQKTNVVVKANVPDGFNEEIKVTLEYEETQVRATVTLTTENGYTKNLTVLSDNTFLASADFQSTDTYGTDLAEKYDIEGEEVELIFNVIPADTKTIEENTEIEIFQDEEMEIDPSTGLPTAESVIKNFEEKVAFIENDSNFDSFLALYSGPMFKEYYLEADSMNTEEQWNNMKEIERFVYYITYIKPFSKMINYEYANTNEFIEELTGEKQRLEQRENGDVVYDAIVDVWEWQYAYWQHTGSIYNFFNDYDDSNAGTPTESEAVKLTENEKEEMEEIEEIKKEIQEELDEESKKKETENQGNVMIVVVCIIFILAVVSGLVIFMKNRKSNK
ncbi:MAG: hypothetical protein IJA32_14520 [Lachnospiraceae bacterium]|nr:hypothetical protein [Lachnospiraceae bacterium]